MSNAKYSKSPRKSLWSIAIIIAVVLIGAILLSNIGIYNNGPEPTDICTGLNGFRCGVSITSSGVLNITVINTGTTIYNATVYVLTPLYPANGTPNYTVSTYLPLIASNVPTKVSVQLKNGMFEKFGSVLVFAGRTQVSYGHTTEPIASIAHASSGSPPTTFR